MTVNKALKEIDELFDELDTLLKNDEVGGALGESGVNVSLAIVAADGLRAYFHGDKERASDDLSTVAEEIRHRLESTRERERREAKDKPS